MSEIKLTEILTELQYDEFVSFVNRYKLNEQYHVVNEIVIPSRLKKIWGFIKKLGERVSLKMVDLVKLFLNKTVFKFFSKIKHIKM